MLSCITVYPAKESAPFRPFFMTIDVPEDPLEASQEPEGVIGSHAAAQASEEEYIETFLETVLDAEFKKNADWDFA